MIFSVALARPAYAGWVEDISEAIDGFVEWVQHLGSEAAPTPPGPSLGQIVRIIGTDPTSSSWANLANIDLQCAAQKILEGTDKALLSQACLNCLDNGTDCQECINEHIDEIDEALWDIIKGECSTPSTGYDAAVVGMWMHPANTIAGQAFDITVRVDSLGEPNSNVAKWGGSLHIGRQGETPAYSEPVVTTARAAEFRSIELEEGQYIATFSIADIARAIRRADATIEYERVTDTNLTNNVMEVPINIGPNPPTNPVTLYVNSENPITLSWTRYSQPDFHKYEVHRSATTNFTPNPNYPLEAIYDNAITTYIDTRAEPGRRYYYKIRVCDVARESAISNEVSATAPEAPIEPPYAYIDNIYPNPITEKDWRRGVHAYWVHIGGGGEAPYGYYILPTQFEWDLGDGFAESGSPGVNHPYQEPGNYTVRLRVQDNRGIWSDWATAVVRVLPPEASAEPQVQPEPEEQPVPEPEPQPATEPVGADLTLLSGTLEFSAPAFKAGKEIKIAVKVKNTGIKKLTPVEVAFWVNEQILGEAKIGGLAPGEKERLIIFWTPAMPGEYTIYAIADPNKRFDEIDEGNNRDSRSIIIEGQD